MKKLENELSSLRQRVTEMGNLTEKMVVDAIDALSSPNADAIIERVMAGEDRLDVMQLEIDKEVIRLLARRPTAS